MGEQNMSNEKIQETLDQTPKMGGYETVGLALDWISVMKQNEDYRKLSQAELINRALKDIADNIATREKVEELREKMKKKSAEKKDAAVPEYSAK
jgi:microsomal dipeptidase-like Zn-dependent dipeptidase